MLKRVHYTAKPQAEPEPKPIPAAPKPKAIQTNTPARNPQKPIPSKTLPTETEKLELNLRNILIPEKTIETQEDFEEYLKLYKNLVTQLKNLDLAKTEGTKQSKGALISSHLKQRITDTNQQLIKLRQYKKDQQLVTSIATKAFQGSRQSAKLNAFTSKRYVRAAERQDAYNLDRSTPMPYMQLG